VLLPTVSNGASKHLTALPGLREKVTGRADPKPTRSRCRRTPPAATRTTTKNTLTSKDATTPTTLTLNGG
jgi:hypothetical protein